MGERSCKAGLTAPPGSAIEESRCRLHSSEIAPWRHLLETLSTPDARAFELGAGVIRQA